MRLRVQVASRRVSRVPYWILLLGLLVHVASCAVKTESEDNDTTNTFVTVTSVESSSGDFTAGQDEGQGLLSDVCATDDDHPPCTVFNDNVIVTFAAFPKDQAVFSGLVNDVVFDRYRVTYTRADGRNVPGVDVPYAFDGVQSFLVPIDGTEVERVFIVVRHQAKLESPLRELSQSAAGLISVLAQIDFYGHDVAGRSIKTTAHLSITFGDFANE